MDPLSSRSRLRSRITARRSGIVVVLAVVSAIALAVLTSTRMEWLSTRAERAFELVQAGDHAQEALAVYDRRSELFENTRGADNEIKPLEPERDLQDALARLDRLSMEWPVRGRGVTHATATVRAYVATREEWERDNPTARASALPAAIRTASEAAQATLATVARENAEVARELRHELGTASWHKIALAGAAAAVLIGALFIGVRFAGEGGRRDARWT